MENTTGTDMRKPVKRVQEEIPKWVKNLSKPEWANTPDMQVNPGIPTKDNVCRYAFITMRPLHDLTYTFVGYRTAAFDGLKNDSNDTDRLIHYTHDGLPFIQGARLMSKKLGLPLAVRDTQLGRWAEAELTPEFVSSLKPRRMRHYRLC